MLVYTRNQEQNIIIKHLTCGHYPLLTKFRQTHNLNKSFSSIEIVMLLKPKKNRMYCNLDKPKYNHGTIPRTCFLLQWWMPSLHKHHLVHQHAAADHHRCVWMQHNYTNPSAVTQLHGHKEEDCICLAL